MGTNPNRRKSTGLTAHARRWGSVSWHRFKVSLCSLGWWARTGVFLVSLGVLGIPVYQKSLVYGLAHTVLVFMAVLGKAAVFSSDRTMKIVQAKYIERKVLLYRLIKELQRNADMAQAEVERFQRETLGLIASYVRSHRGDLSEKQIYVNLLIEDGQEIIVIARDSEHRLPGARYARNLMAATEAFDTGDHVVVGDVHREYGDTEKGYRSILALPVRGPSSVIAVLSIDSAEAHHFDLEADDLERYLAPYIALLEWSLLRCHPSKGK